MINLLPPSPAPSQIDTTFQRRERVEITPDRSLDNRNSARASDDVQKPDDERKVDDQKPEKSENEENTAPSDFEAFLKLIAAPKPHKKAVDLPTTTETPKSSTPEDKDASMAIAAMAQLLTSEQSQNSSTTIKVAAGVVAAGNLIPSVSESTAKQTSPDTTKTAIELIQTTTDPAVTALLKANSAASSEAASPALSTATASAEASLKSAPEIESQKSNLNAVAFASVEPNPDAISEIPMQVIAQTSRNSSGTSEMKTAELTTAFETSQIQPFSVTQSAPERDEITREIERLIAAATGRPESTQPLAVTSTSAIEPTTLTAEISDSNSSTMSPADVMTEQPGSRATAPPVSEPHLLELQSQKNRSGHSTGSAIADAETVSPRSVSTSHQNSSAAAWNGASGTSTDLGTTTSAELREPLSSQTARAIVHHFETHKPEENETLTVRLDPPELGELTIELSKTRDGLAVRVTARESVTMDMLLARGSEIEQHLKNQNVDVATMEFASSGMMNQQSSRQHGSRQTQEDLMIESSRRLPRMDAGNSSNVKRDSASSQDSSRALSFRA